MLTANRISQKQKILNLLKARGKHGVYNWELPNELHILKYTNRLSELYKDGWDIRKEFVGNGTFRYILMEEKELSDV
jgi:hypothetical protein